MMLPACQYNLLVPTNRIPELETELNLELCSTLLLELGHPCLCVCVCVFGGGV
jgi:hypothetical protein